MSKALVVFGALFIACATGGSQSQSGDAGPTDAPAVVHHDASNVGPGDAPMMHDAGVHPLDAFVPQDADQGGGFCSDNTNCGTGTCCWVAICIPGTPIGTTLCIPN